MNDVILGILAIAIGALFALRGYLTMRVPGVQSAPPDSKSPFRICAWVTDGANNVAADRASSNSQRRDRCARDGRRGPQ